MNREKIKVRWLHQSLYKSEATLQSVIAEKDRMVIKGNEKLPEPYTVAECTICATSDSESGDELYIRIDRYETDVEQDRRIKAIDMAVRREIDKQTKVKQNREDPEWNEYLRLQKKFKLPM